MSRITRFILTLALISLVTFVDMFAATPPSKQARFIGVLNKTSTTIQINFQKGNGLNRAVVVSPDATVETPVDEETYTDENGSYASAYDLGNGDKVVDILTGGSTGTNITGLTPGVTYTIQVFEFSTGGSPSPAYNTSTAPVNPRSETTLISVLPPDNLTITNGFPTATTVEFTWTNPTPTPDSYLVTLEQGGNPVSFYDMLDISLIEELEITELDEGTTYDFFIRSYIGNSESVDATVNFTTLVDNTAPTLTSADMHLNGSQSDLLYSDNAGDDVTIVVEFNEPMKTWIFPTITLTGQPSGMTYESGYWNEPGTIFTAEYGFTDDNETVLDIDIQVSGGEDLAGNAYAGDLITDDFNVDTEEGDLSAFNYETAGSFSGGSQSHCKSADNEDVIEFEITLAENGFMPANSLFEVKAEDQDNDNQIVFTSGNSGNGVYLFTSTLATGHAEGEYNLIIKFTDGAGNVTEDLSNSFLFRIDNTPPSISNVNFANTCVNGDDIVTLTFDASDVDGCGTLDLDDILVENNTELDNPWVFDSQVGTLFTYTLDVESDPDGSYDVTITATDDAGNESTDETTGAFTIDNTAPTITNVAITPATCVNNTTELTLTFDVTDVIVGNCGAIDGDFNGDISISSNNVGSGALTTAFSYQGVTGPVGDVLSFTYTMTVDENNAQDDTYIVEIDVDDKAGNSAIQNTSASFTVDNTKPLIQNQAYDVTCVNGEDVVTLTFEVVEEGCGTFDENDITITGTSLLTNDFAFAPTGGTWASTGTYGGTSPISLAVFNSKLYSANASSDDVYEYDGTSWTSTGTYGGDSPRSLAEYNGKLYAANASSDDVYEYDGTNWVSTGAYGGDAPQSLAVFNSKLYSANVGSDDVFEYDGTNWVSTGTYGGGFPQSLAEYNGKLYAANNVSDDVFEYDGTNWVSTGTYGGDDPRSLAEYNGLLYSANSGTNDVYEYDGTSWTSTGAYGGAAPYNLLVYNGKLYAANTSSDDVYVYDGTSWTSTGTYGGDSPRSLAEYNGKLYAANTNSHDVFVFNPGVSGSGTVGDPYVFTYTLDIDALDSDGDLDIAINATDDAGNDADEVEDLAAFTIDNSAPVFSAYTVTGLDGSCLKVGSTLEFTVDVVEDGCGTFDETDFTIGITPVPTNALVPDGGNPVSGTGTYKFTLLLDAGDTEGAYNLTFDGTDDAGNAATQYVPGGVEFTLDKTAPVFSAYTVTGLDGSCLVEGETIEFTVEVVEAGCGTFDSDDITILVTPALTNSLVANGTNPANGSGTYKFSAVIHADDIDGDYEITFNGTDVAGNAATEYAEAGVEFAIDNTPPQLSNLVTTSVKGGSPTRVGGTAPNRVLTIAFDELTDGCANLVPANFSYTITGPGSTALTVGIDGAPTDNAGTWTTTVTVPTDEPDGDYEIIITAEDDKGNVFTLDPAGVEFVIDNTPPVVSIVRGVSVPVNPNRASDKIIRSDDGANNFYIEFVYNEDMDTSVDPTYSFPTVSERPNVAVPPSTFAAITNAVAAPGAAGWQGDNRSFRFYFDVDQDAEIDMEGINIKATGGQDVVGNVHTNVTEINVFDVDLITPGLSNVVATPSLVTNNFTNMQIDFTFDEEMDLSLVPTITFPLAPTVGGAISIVPGTSSWLTDFVYRATYAVTVSSGIELTNVQVKIENANDACGNPFDPTPVNNVFSVDTKEPACAGITLDPIENQVLADFLDFEVEVKMDQVLNNTVHPTVTFTNSNANYSTSVGTFSTTTNTNDTYTFIVTHDGTEEELTETISIIGFKDLNGNEQTVACETTFDVDTDKPDIVSITVSDDKICMDDDNDAYTITIVFDEEMDGVTQPDLTLTPDHSAIFTGVTGGWSQTSVNNDTYTFNTTLDLSAGIEALVSIDVSAAMDLLGNTMVTDTDSGDDKFSIDTKAPEVTSVFYNPSPSNIYGVNRSTIGVDGFAVVITYDEAMDDNSTPTITLDNISQGGTGTPGAALTAGSGSWTSANEYTQNYTVNNAVVELELVTVDISGATDLCGNTQDLFDGSTEESAFAIDLIAPTCDFLETEYSLINEDRLLLQQLIANFSEPMDETIDVQFNFAVSSNFTVQNDGNWDEDDEYIVTAFHNGTEEGRFTETITLDLSGTLPKDLAGNPIESASCDYDFDVDTKKPLVSTVTFTPNKVIGTTSSFFVTVEFDEDMKAAPNPTIQFNETLTGLFNYVGYTTPNATTFVYQYGVNDVDFEFSSIDIDIAIGQDVAGNVMATHTSTETFAIDQVEPTVTNVTFSSHPGWINRADIGAGNFTVAVTYDEVMDDQVSPTISIDPFAQGNPTVDDALVFASDSWNVGKTVYTATYNVVDVAFADEQLFAFIGDAKDACGNTQEFYQTDSEGDGKINIDLIDPTISFDQTTPLGESCVNGTEAIDFTAGDVNFFDKVQARIDGGTFTTFTSGSLLNTVAGWGAASEGEITLDLRALDFAGNYTTITRDFGKDITNPNISSVVKAPIGSVCVKPGDYYYVDVTATDNGGCGTFDENNISFSTNELENDFEYDSSPSTNKYRFKVLIDNDDAGNVDYVVVATDDAGNTDTFTPQGFDIQVDKTVPVVSGINVSATCVNGGSLVTLIFFVDEGAYCNIDETNITINDNLASTNNWNTTLLILSGTNYIFQSTLLIDGSDPDQAVDLTIDVSDVAGNTTTGNGSGNTDFTVDNTAPAITNVVVTAPTCVSGGTTATLTFDVVENGCGTFTNNNITVNDNVTTNNAWSFFGENLGTYTYKLLIDANDPDGAVDVTVSATDAAGNTTTNADEFDTDFTIDNSGPTLSDFNVVTSPACVNTGSEVVTVTFKGYDDGCADFDETYLTITSGLIDDAGNTVITSGFGTSASPYLFTTTFDVAGGDNDGDYNITVNAVDGNGNTSNELNPALAEFTVDNTAPTLATITVTSDECVNNGLDKITFTFTGYDDGCGTFDESNLTVTSTSSATPQFDSKTGLGTSGTPYVFTYTLDISDADNDYDLFVNATDGKGNTSTPLTSLAAFTVDNTAPAVAFQDPEGGETVNASKVLHFIATDDGCGIVSTEVSVDNTNWTAANSGNMSLGDIVQFGDLSDGAFTLYIRSTDFPGNEETNSVPLIKDATAPEVLSFTPSHSVISTQNDGEEFTITFDFNEDMDTSIDPTVGISLVQVLPQNSVSGNWTDSDTYVASFGNINASISITYIDAGVSISGAKDDTEDIGNEMFLDVDATLFDVDTEAPTITDASIKSSNSVNDQYARVGNDIILTIEPSEALTAITGTIAGYGITSTSDQYLLNGTYVITVSTDPGVPAGLVTFAVNYEDVNGNAGTTLTSVTDPSSVTVDKVAPVGTIDRAAGQADITSDSPINFALTFSEDVYGLTDSDINVSGSANATTAVVTGSGDTYNVEVSGMTGSGTVVITLANATVTDIAGNDNTATANTDNSVLYNVSGATEVASGTGAEPATLSSLVDTQGEAVLNFDFDVTDDGAVPGADLLATKITDISVSQGVGNDIADWTTVLAGAELFDGTNTVAGTVGATTIDFTGLAHGAGQIGEVADNATKTYTLKVWLSNTPSGLIDNENLAFLVNRSSFTVDGAGSSFKSGAGDDVESGSTNNEIDVDATELTFTTTPTSTEINTNTTFVIEATDANGNRDVDYGPSTVTLTPNLSTIFSGGSGSMTNGILTLSTVQFSVAKANDYVTAADGTITDGVSDNFNIKEEEPAAITNLSIVNSSTSFALSWTNSSNKNSLILAKKDGSSSFAYSDEIGMDDEMGWPAASTVYGNAASPADNDVFVIYAGSSTSITMTGLQNNYTLYTVTAYSYAGALNSGVQNFNTSEASLESYTYPKEVDLSDGIRKGLRLGIDNITPQPASLNNVVSLQVETIEDMPLTLELYDSKGQKMMTLFEGRDFNAGETQFEFNLDNSISSGQHFLRLTGNGHVVIAPLVIVK